MILDEIIALATDDAASLSMMLRKCLVLSHFLKNDRLKTWALGELNGYRQDAEVPEYRKAAAGAKGNFMGGGGATLNDFFIPPQLLDKKDRRFGESVILGQAVAAYEDIMQTPRDKGKITAHWPNGMIGYYLNRIPISGGMQLVDAWQEIPRSAIAELLDTIKTRALCLALELKDEVGDDENALKHLSQTATEIIDQKVVQQIFHGPVYVATDNASMKVQNNNALRPGDWNQLAKVLEDSGITKPDVLELSKAIEADGGKTVGTSVTAWIKERAPSVLASGVKMGAEVGKTLLTDWIKMHFGIH